MLIDPSNAICTKAVDEARSRQPNPERYFHKASDIPSETLT
jgi:hypothetical protein